MNKQINTILLSSELIKTIRLLRVRLSEHFPDSGLYKTNDSLYEIAKNIEQRILWINTPNITLRMFFWTFIISLLLVIIALFKQDITNSLSVFQGLNNLNVSDLMQMLDASFNLIILAIAGFVFIYNYETRRKTSRIIESVNKLKCIAHLIDAHQLTKDPLSISYNEKKHDLTEYQLGLYLDYCSDLLSLVNKLAFLYIQNYNDPKANESVNNLENFTAQLSFKLGQKIALLQTVQKENSIK
jgi:hypothetical protein